jgi:ribosomal protein RSM22 (predicted rRNA methylase)
MSRMFSLPPSLTLQLEKYFGDLESVLKSKPTLAAEIEALSKQFQNPDSVTDWDSRSKHEAYFLYFHTLNVVRLLAVFRELQIRIKDFNPKVILDYGSGLGASEIAFATQIASAVNWLFVENDIRAQNFHKELRPFKGRASWHRSLIECDDTFDTAIASYSLNEQRRFPQELLRADTVIFVEPATKDHTRNLMRLRDQLINEGYQIAAPCTHQSSCPLLKHSQTDWCYDRIFVERPPWLEALEEKLPMTNRTVTFSYLVATRNQLFPLAPESARVIGDTLKEKGKTRQMVCRGDEREFLSWLDRDGPASPLPHGALIELPKGISKKGNEIRGAEGRSRIL